MQRLTPEDLIRDVSKVGDFSLSPNALEVAFSWQSENESNIYISSIPEFEPKQITFGKEHRVLPLWSPDSSKIAFLQDNDGDESFNLFTVSLCDGEVHQITEFTGCNFRGYSWSPNGDFLAFAANIDGCYSIFIIQSDGRGLRRLTSATRHDILPQWSPKGDYIVYTKLESGNKFSSVQIINMNGIREASKCSAKSSLTAKTWDSNGIRIVSHCMKPGSKNLGLFQPDTGRVLWIQEEECELGRVWSKDGNYSACVIDNKRNSQMVILDNSNGTKKMIGPGRGLSEEPEFSCDNRFVVFLHEGPQNPSDLYLYDIVKDELKQLTEGLPDHVDASELVIPEEIMCPSYDGLQIPALVYKPQVSKGSGLPPAVLRIHGGPNYRSYINWDPTIQLLVSHGYIVFAPNYRGSTGYGNEFMELNRNDWGGGDLKDVIAAASYLEKEELADASRIGLYGGSYGGYLTLMAMATSPEKWVCGVCLYGITDLEIFYCNLPDYLKDWVKGQIGTPEENPTVYRYRSPLALCKDIQAPLLFIHGANDPRITLKSVLLLKEKMEASEKIFELMIYNDEGHGFQKQINCIDADRQLLDYFNTHIMSIG